MEVEQKSSNGSDEFPVGMRVLAVDDDPACLKVLEARLRKCKYHVTTTNQAVLALQMLRENKDKFDLVISDVCMPDMDGFKLLELVGLEMDLPVIMLSAYGDTQHVTKGIYHGACDYLLKPVRDEELKLIWQHVVRRKIDKNRRDEVGDGFSDQNGKLTKKRKDSSAPKKPRVSWTPELHGKFVAAVDHLGVDKAFPTSILKMMNDEKLTKENVASHLQKYRSYLKRISREASMVISPNRLSDPAYLQMGSSVHVPTFVGFEKKSLGSYPPNNLFGRSNSPAGNGMGTFGISSLPMIQESYGQQSINPMNPSVGDKPIISPISSVFLGERRDCGTSNYSFLDTQNTHANSMLPLQSSQMESSYVLNAIFSPTSSNIGPHDDLESLAGFENGSSLIGQLSSVGPSSIMQYNEDHMAQMMPPDSYVGSLEDIVNAIMKEEKGKGKVILKEGHSRCDAFCHSIGNCIYT